MLDKSPRIVEYQLKRLSNAELLLADRDTSDAKYLPVFRAILMRPGISRRDREEALQGVVSLNSSTPIVELLEAIGSVTSSDRNSIRLAEDLTEMLLRLPESDLQNRQDALAEAAGSETPVLRAAGLAALITAGDTDTARAIGRETIEGQQALLKAVGLVRRPEQRNPLRPVAIALLQSPESSVETQKAAIGALAEIPEAADDSFRLLAALLPEAALRPAVVQALLRLISDSTPKHTADTVVSQLTALAENTPAAERTSEEFQDAMQLADRLLSHLPPEPARGYRNRLREITVRVIQLRTVEEEMRYDRPYFAVEAGRPVQLVLINEDLMPHNIVLTVPGRMKEVALAAAALGQAPGRDGMQYVPDMPEIVTATGMIAPGKRDTVTFTAPTEPGEYPYVCTFPQHWMRMYGVMVVVSDLDGWQRNPTEPKDPLGSNRSFVRKWSIDDFPDDLPSALRGRSENIGARLFREATCAGCHKVSGEGGIVGPELNGILTRHKGSYRAVLREILDPSYRIDEKYAVRIIVTDDGRTHTGIVVAEDRSSVSLLTNPDVPVPMKIERKTIEEEIPSTTSMMPKALLDKYSADEVLEILSYITSAPVTSAPDNSAP